MKKIAILTLTLCINNVLSAPEVIDKIIAIVDNDIILESDMKNMLRIVKINAEESHKKLPDEMMLRNQILDQLITDSIILQFAMRSNITISDEELDQIIKNISTKDHSLDRSHNHLIHDDRNYGSSSYRTQIRKKVLIAMACNSVVNRRITILPQEVDSLLKEFDVKNDDTTEFNLSHILIRLPENPTQIQVEKAEALVRTLIDQSKGNSSFDKLALIHSTASQTLINDQIGWKKLKELPSLFAVHLQYSQKDSIVGPIRSDVGLHILKINDIRNDSHKKTVTEVHARHIFLRASSTITDQKIYTTLKNVAQKIKSGQISFSVAAKQLSEDQNSAHRGGDLGWISTDKLNPVFQNTLMHLKKGEMSTPICSPSGWHLIQLINIRTVDHTDAEKDRAYNLLLSRKFNEEVKAWIQEQRASVYVKIFDNA